MVHQVHLGLLLGNEHHADGGVRGHLGGQRDRGHLPGLHRDVQLHHSGLQHQLRGSPHRDHPREPGVQEAQAQDLPPHVQGERGLQPSGVEDLELHRGVVPDQGDLRARRARRGHRVPAQAPAERVPQGGQQDPLRRTGLPQQPVQEEPADAGRGSQPAHLPPRGGHREEGQHHRLLHHPERVRGLHMPQPVRPGQQGHRAAGGGGRVEAQDLVAGLHQE